MSIGRTVVDRLIWIVQHCPTIAPQAVHLALAQLQQLRDPNLYGSLKFAYEQVVVAAKAQDTMTPWAELVRVGPEFQEELVKRNGEEKTRLEVELKTYTSNMIKESIRVSCAALFFLLLFCFYCVVCAEMCSELVGRWPTETWASSIARLESTRRR